jgi:hypothetical protein
MDVNPYESPQAAEETTPLVATKRPLWLDAIYLLATAGVLAIFGGFVTAMAAMLSSWLLRIYG